MNDSSDKWALAAPVIALLLAYLGAGCSEERRVPVPPFDIEVTLSEAARQKLESAGETIGVVIYFDGDGQSKPGEETAPFRDVFLGKHEVELRQPGRLRISDAKISEEAVRRLSEPNYHFTINIASGRRVFKDNLLSLGTVYGRASDLNPAKPIVIACGLLEPLHTLRRWDAPAAPQSPAPTK